MEFSRRKWGYYLTLISRDYFKVKLLYFKKGKSCSKQRHHERDELWCFLFGEGSFTISEDIKCATVFPVKGDFIEVLMNRWHQFTAHKPTLVLEIQTGECREDDIERVA